MLDYTAMRRHPPDHRLCRSSAAIPHSSCLATLPDLIALGLSLLLPPVSALRWIFPLQKGFEASSLGRSLLIARLVAPTIVLLVLTEVRSLLSQYRYEVAEHCGLPSPSQAGYSTLSSRTACGLLLDRRYGQSRDSRGICTTCLERWAFGWRDSMKSTV